MSTAFRRISGLALASLLLATPALPFRDALDCDAGAFLPPYTLAIEAPGVADWTLRTSEAILSSTRFFPASRPRSRRSDA